MKVETWCWIFLLLVLDLEVICYKQLKQRWNKKFPTNPKKIVLVFVFREISSIVYNFSSCCELQKCRESPTWIFLLCFSTNRHIWRIVKLSYKFQKFSNFASSDFSVFLHESAHLITFGTILWISNICKFVKRRFFLYFSTNCYIWQFLGLFCKFRKFAYLENLNFFVFLNELTH